MTATKIPLRRKVLAIISQNLDPKALKHYSRSSGSRRRSSGSSSSSSSGNEVSRGSGA